MEKIYTYIVSHAYMCCSLTTSVVHFPTPTLDDSNKVHGTPVYSTIQTSITHFYEDQTLPHVKVAGNS